jgi:anthranilate/para-aminobenzoate synthase component I
MSFLFESVEGGAVRGRYSVIGLDPDVVWRTRGAQAEINRAAGAETQTFVPCAEPPLPALRALIAESRINLPEGLPPMAAGVFGYLGYDMVRLMEDLPASHPDPIGIPDAVLIRPTLIVVFDAVKDSITVVTPVRPLPGVTAKAAHARAQDRLSSVVDALDRHLDKSAAVQESGPIDVPAKSNTTPERYRAMVQKAKDYILAGDIFQVVLSQRLQGRFGAGCKSLSIHPAAHLGLGAAGPPDHVGIEADHRITAAHGATLDRLEQETHRPRAGNLEKRRNRRLKIGNQRGPQHLGLAAVVPRGEGVGRGLDLHRFSSAAARR